MYILEFLAIVSAGLFAGAAIYINAVEHPARMECGTDIAIRQWRPSYRRATIMQSSLAFSSFVASILVWFFKSDFLFLLGGLLIATVIPFTLLVIFPTNKKLMSEGMNLSQTEALLNRWNRLHLVRSLCSLCAFLVMVMAVIRR
jgi:hypothetical protein